MRLADFCLGTAMMIGPAAAQEPSARPESPLRLVRAYPNLTFDDNAAAAAVTPDAAKRTVVALQRGQLRVLPQDREASEAPLFLDLREKMKEETEFEEGVHGLAFHPNFASTRRVYLCYSQRGPRRTVLSEFVVPEGSELRTDPRTERVILEYPHPLGNHWGGGIAFGPDGMLYVAIGDGGLRDDPYRLGQNLWSLHGKILRLDVDGRSAGLAYRIPPDNPFGERQETRDEIYAYGLRNPWGMSFDRETGTLWCGDVGQDHWEEVNVIKAGGNYGWSERDGPGRLTAREAAPEEGGPYIDPIHAYGHEEGISITGGFVYRGSRLPSLQGQYIFGDWGMGKIWGLSWDPSTVTTTAIRPIFLPEGDLRINPTVITRDADGEPLIFSHSPSVIYTLEEQTVLAESEVAEDLGVQPLPDPGEFEMPSIDPVTEPDAMETGG